MPVLPSLAETDLSAKTGTKQITLGFDGYIDSVVRIIRRRDADGRPHFFERSADLATYILEKSTRNFSLELHQNLLKFGGNTPITAHAFSRLGCQVHCIGALGYPAIHPVFRHFPDNCHLYSYAEPRMSTAFEFRDNKMMMAESTLATPTTWDGIRNLIGRGRLLQLFSGKDLIGLLNWSEVDYAGDVWRGLLTEILPAIPPQSVKPYGLVDLSDCSAKTPEELLDMLDMLRAFNQYWRVILSLNRNESGVLYRMLTGNQSACDPVETAAFLYRSVGVEKIVLHHATWACCADEAGISQVETGFITDPVLLTGAGDHFNAGFCTALLLDLPVKEALKMAHSVTREYITSGLSPAFGQVFA